MGFLSGLTSSAGLTAATNAVGSYQHAQATEADKQKAEAMQQIMMLRSQHEQQLKDALMSSQTKNFESETATRGPKEAAAEADRQSNLYLKGFRPGQAPKMDAIKQGLQVASQFAGPGAAIGVAGTVADNPEQYAPDRFKQVNPNQYLDTTATPEAIAQRHTDQASANSDARATAAGDRSDARAAATGDRSDARLTRTLQASSDRQAAALKAADNKPNDAERGSAAFAGQLAQSAAVLDRIGSPAVTAQILRKHGTWGNFLISKEGQEFNQAADHWVNSAQFATEGVRFSPEKEKAMRVLAIPNGATDPAVVKQMTESRAMLARTAGIKAGRAKNLVHPDVQNALGWNDGKSGLEPVAQNPLHQTVDQMIKAGKTDAEIKAALGHP